MFKVYYSRFFLGGIDKFVKETTAKEKNGNLRKDNRGNPKIQTQSAN